MIETNRIEFKRELTRELDIEKEVVAFLNYREGGIIYIGVDDNGKPVDIKDIDGDMLAIKNRIRDGILPTPMGLFDVTVERIDEKPVIKVFVSSGTEKPYYKKQYGLSPKGCFIRIGTAAEPMTQEQIDAIGQGRVWTGAMALERGLVDVLGGLDDAIDIAVKKAGVEGYTLKSYPEQEGGIFSMFSDMKDNTIRQQMLKGDAAKIFNDVYTISQMDKIDRIQARMPYNIIIK